MSAKRTSTGDVTNQKSGISQIGFEQIVETALEGICVVNEQNLISYINPQFTNLLGFTADEMIGRQFVDFIHENDLSEFEELMKHPFGKRDHFFDLRIFHKDGTQVWVQLDLRQVTTNNRKYMVFVAQGYSAAQIGEGKSASLA